MKMPQRENRRRPRRTIRTICAALAGVGAVALVMTGLPRAEVTTAAYQDTGYFQAEFGAQSMSTTKMDAAFKLNTDQIMISNGESIHWYNGTAWKELSSPGFAVTMLASCYDGFLASDGLQFRYIATSGWSPSFEWNNVTTSPVLLPFGEGDTPLKYLEGSSVCVATDGVRWARSWNPMAAWTVSTFGGTDVRPVDVIAIGQANEEMVATDGKQYWLSMDHGDHWKSFLPEQPQVPAGASVVIIEARFLVINGQWYSRGSSDSNLFWTAMSDPSWSSAGIIPNITEGGTMSATNVLWVTDGTQWQALTLSGTGPGAAVTASEPVPHPW